MRVFRNSGKLTEIKVPVGLPKESRPNSKSLFDSVKRAPTNISKPVQSSNQPKNNFQPQKSTIVPPLNALPHSMNPVQLKATTNYGSNQSISSSSTSLAAAAAAKKRPPPPPAKRKIPKCEAIFNYDATEADELSFKVGDMILVTGRDDPGFQLY